MILKDINNSLIFNKEKVNYPYAEGISDQIPIYVILTSGTSIVSSAIMKVTKSKYSHATIALNYYETISMGTTAKNFGLVVESIFEFPDRHRDGNMKICRRMVSRQVFEAMTYQVIKFKKNWKKIDYSWSKLGNFFKWIPKKRVSSYKDETSFICSEFVALVLGELEDFRSKLPSQEERGGKFILSPREIEKNIMNTFEVIYEGSVYDMPMSLLYDLDKKYVKVKKQITESVMKNMKSVKHYSESNSSNPSLYNSSLKLDVKRNHVKDRELSSLHKAIL